jgi:hypothetical protein
MNEIQKLIAEIETLVAKAAPLAQQALQLNDKLPGKEQSPHLGGLTARLNAAQESIAHHKNFVTPAAEAAN